MSWWHWLALGLILVALEMAASGGFYVIFFGVAAIAIGGLHLFDLAGPLWFQFLLFSVLAVGSLLLFRNPLMRLLRLDTPGADVDSLVGETAIRRRISIRVASAGPNCVEPSGRRGTPGPRRFCAVNAVAWCVSTG